MDIAEFSGFETLSEFKWSLETGGEIEFEWNGNSFGIFKYMKKVPDSKEQILIAPSDTTKNQNSKKYPEYYADTVDEILDYIIDGEKLRNIVTKIKILWRTI